jgi:hypothetical protein
MARIRFKVTRTYDTGGPGQGPKFPQGYVLDESGVSRAVGFEVDATYAQNFLERWVRRGAAEYVDGRTPVTDPDPLDHDASGKKGGAKAGGEGVDGSEAEPELETLTRAELDALAASRGVDISGAHTKADVISSLQKTEKIAAGDFEGFTRAELEEIAAGLDVDLTDARTKADVFERLQRAAKTSKA